MADNIIEAHPYPLGRSIFYLQRRFEKVLNFTTLDHPPCPRSRIARYLRTILQAAYALLEPFTFNRFLSRINAKFNDIADRMLFERARNGEEPQQRWTEAARILLYLNTIQLSRHDLGLTFHPNDEKQYVFEYFLADEDFAFVDEDDEEDERYQHGPIGPRPIPDLLQIVQHHYNHIEGRLFEYVEDLPCSDYDHWYFFASATRFEEHQVPAQTVVECYFYSRHRSTAATRQRWRRAASMVHDAIDIEIEYRRRRASEQEQEQQHFERWRGQAGQHVLQLIEHMGRLAREHQEQLVEDRRRLAGELEQRQLERQRIEESEQEEEEEQWVLIPNHVDLHPLLFQPPAA